MTPRHEQSPQGAPAALAARITGPIPALETSRLTLRCPEARDFPAFAEILCGPRGKWIDGPMDRPDAWNAFAAMTAGWILHGHGPWTVVDHATDDALGFVIIGLEPGDREPELGYFFREAAEGRGFAQEAATAARSFARKTLALPSLVSYVDAGNTRSRALAERLGATLDADRIEGALVYRHWGPQ